MATATRILTAQEVARARAAFRRRRAIGRFFAYFFLTVFGLLFAFPLYWTMSSSLQTWQELRSFHPQLLPSVPQWDNYVQVFTITPFARWMLNTLSIIAIAIPGSLITGTMAAYAFGRFNFFGRNVWFLVMLGTMMIPSWVTLIPQYLLFFQLKLINTYVPLTIGSWLGGGAFTIFLLRQFIMSIPRDLDEAARIDGAGPLRILVQVIVPLMKPALTTLAILSFLGHWNDFFGPFIYLNKKILFTAAVGLRFFQTMPMEANEPKDHLLMAAASITTIPVLIVFVLAQRYFVQGVVMSGLKM
jgi:ABC-type glycerol-3-phosphate transport system permease component